MGAIAAVILFVTLVISNELVNLWWRWRAWKLEREYKRERQEFLRDSRALREELEWRQFLRRLMVYRDD